MEKNREKIKLRFILPLGLTILVLLATCVITLHQLHNHHINQETQKSLNKVSRLFRMELEEDAELLEGMIGFLQKDKNLQDAWLAGDRESLQRYASPVFEEICSKHKVTHFYFHDLDRVNFLRVHNPQKHGDHIDRFTMNQAAGSGKSAWGIELGPLGTFTLRFVYPWRIDGKPAGYIELGQEIEHIMPELVAITGAELFFVINKSYLNRADWEQGMEMLGQTGDWDQFPDFVISDRSLKQLPPKVHKYLSELSECQSKEHLSSMFNVSLGKHRYRVGLLPLTDAGGTEVGEIIVLKDITSLQASLKSLSISLIWICSAVGVLLLVFFYLYTTRIEQRLETGQQYLRDSNQQLESEITERKRTEQELKESEYSLAMAQRAACVGSWDWDILNDKLTWSDETYRQMGLKPNEIEPTYEAFQEFVHPDDLEETNEAVRVALEEHKLYSIEARMFRKDGTEWVMHAQGIIQRNDDGKVVRFIGTQQDLTERKQVEERLQEARHKAEAANMAKKASSLPT